MEPELENELIRKYPRLFRQHSLPITESCLAWGLECGKGWYPIIEEACSKLQKLLDSGKYEMIEFAQIKQKFATLRLYYDVKGPPTPWWARVCWWLNHHLGRWKLTRKLSYKFNNLAWRSDPVNRITSEAEWKSAVTCEVCGKPGKLRGRYWVYTACEEHTREQDKGTDLRSGY